MAVCHFCCEVIRYRVNTDAYWVTYESTLPGSNEVITIMERPVCRACYDHFNRVSRIMADLAQMRQFQLPANTDH